MKKSVIALAVLATAAGAASAQSSVTIYGRVDGAYSKNIGSKVRGINDTQQSRLGFKGVEDLGGGLKAVFNLESGLNLDTGSQAGSGTQFWNRRAVVGLETGFGRVLLGREYTPAYTLVESVASPWGTDTVAGNTNGLRKLITGSELDPIRNSNSANYSISTSGFTFAAQWAAKEDLPTTAPVVVNSRASHAYGLAGSYAAGPLYLALGYTNPYATDDHWTTVSGSYDLGVVKLGGFFGTGRRTPLNTSVTVGGVTTVTGTEAAGDKARSWLLSAVAPLGGGELRFAYGQYKQKVDFGANNGNERTGTAAKITALGYHYFLSKRTRVYVDVANDSKNTVSKTGYDVGLRHDF